jgi:hypothetical protein
LQLAIIKFSLGGRGSRRGKSGGIWAYSAQKDLRLQKDFANSNRILLEIQNKFVERVLASGRRNSFCKVTYLLNL